MQSPIRAILLLIFIAVPLLEIALLIKIGQAIGFWATILLVFGTAAIGTWLLHAQGLETLRRVMVTMEAGKPPVAPVLDGFLLLAAGLLLLTPGIITDTMGLVLLIPPVRTLIVRYGLTRLLVVTVGGRTWQDNQGSRTGQRTADTWSDVQQDREWPANSRQKRPTSGEGPIIEGEYERLEERTIDPRRGKR
ncbi:MAG TPA: FxsA family protein [Hyphomicrobiaceae bacterium]|nr:FxsA family protein [Hyphomicrobiaceae bacterium]